MTSRRPEGALRKGWTTGACATAATAAAYEGLLTGRIPETVRITLPRGERPVFAVARAQLDEGRAMASVIKDAGDDPDVTHGAEIVAMVEAGPPGSGVTFAAGEGVGTVTRPGLQLSVGEPAINPVPRRMMAEAVAALAANHGAPGDVRITVSIPGGEDLARRTMNGRLGIVGGLSILGTTGVVIPYSCSSWIHSIQRGVDVARAAGLVHIAGATGKTSERAVARAFDLPESALIDMGDFAGALLKYLRDHPVARLTIAGGFAKLVKLGDGHMDLHSGRSRVDMQRLAVLLGNVGGDAALVAAARQANTAGQVLAMARDAGLPLADVVARRARESALAVISGGVSVDVMVVDRQGRIVAHAHP